MQQIGRVVAIKAIRLDGLAAPAAQPGPTAAEPVAKPESARASAAPAEATVLIRTTPPGAVVVIDGDRQTACVSPCSLNLPAGTSSRLI